MMIIVKKMFVVVSLVVSLLCYSGFTSAEQLESTQAVSIMETITFNINSADAGTISDLMNGVGPKKAQAIIDYRSANGPFENLDALLAVKGIGNVTISKNKEVLVFN